MEHNEEAPTQAAEETPTPQQIAVWPPSPTVRFIMFADAAIVDDVLAAMAREGAGILARDQNDGRTLILSDCRVNDLPIKTVPDYLVSEVEGNMRRQGGMYLGTWTFKDQR